MKSQGTSLYRNLWGESRGLVWVSALALGCGSALIRSHSAILVALLALLAYALFALKSLQQPLVFVFVFLLILILLPPFFWGRLGQTPIYLSTLLLPVGLGVLWMRLPDLHVRFDLPAWGLIVFLLGTGLSLPFGWWLSGTEVGNQSFFRWLLLAQTALIYCLVRGGAQRHETRLERALMPVLVIAACLSAAYGILDFIWPIPIPHPAADEYIWLRTSIMRRAQGVFYEAGNFANMCAVFLVISISAILSKRERTFRIPLPWFVFFAGLLGMAVLVSFTRSTWVSVVVAVVAFVVVSKEARWRRAGLCIALLSVPVIALRFYSPDLWDYLLSSRLGSLSQLLLDPNLASSGRFGTWTTIFSIAAGHPQFLLFGVGYKTLPFTQLFHEPIITDNGFLNLLLESGIAGLVGFLFFTYAVLRTFLRMAGKRQGASAFWGSVLFALWCSECAQMLALDAYTYWRNMTVIVALMGFAMNRLEREELEPARE